MIQNKTNEELLNELEIVRDNIEMNASAFMAESLMVNIEEETKIKEELNKRDVDYNEDWKPPQPNF